MHITFRSHLLYMVLFTSFTFVQAQLGGDPMFEIVEHVEVIHPESAESCAECPTFKYEFEVGDERVERLAAGLKEHVIIYLKGDLNDSCRHSFSGSAANQVIFDTDEKLILELPLNPGSVTLRVDYEGDNCPCENTEIELEVYEPVSVKHSIVNHPTIKTEKVFDDDNVFIGLDTTIVNVPLPIWHIENKVSAGTLYKTVLSPVGISFARLHIWEGGVSPASVSGTYFLGLDANTLQHPPQDPGPWNSVAYSGSTAALGFVSRINEDGIFAGDRVFGAFNCIDVWDALKPGSLTWEIPLIRETEGGGSDSIALVTQGFYHSGAKKKVKRAKSYVSKAGVSSGKVGVTASTYIQNYYTSSTQTRIPLCN